MTNLANKVDVINGQLRSLGREAVQEIKMEKDGKVIGQIRYGYKPQYVFDAVNAIIGPENWRYEVIAKEIFDTQAVVEVRLFIKTETEWICKGSQIGQMLIVKGNVGDAYKGATTDAIQKCLSLLSIGCDSYKGLLKIVYFGSVRKTGTGQTTTQQPRINSPGQPQQAPRDHDAPSPLPTVDELPVIAGIQYQRRNGFVLAVGKSYDKKELLKSAGFKWNKEEKGWIKDIIAATH